MLDVNNKLLDTLYLPIIITDDKFNFVFHNRAFERFSREINIDHEPFITFTQTNLSAHLNKFTKPFEIPGKRIFIHAEKIDGFVVIHVEMVRQTLINALRREIINQFSASLSHIFYNLITIIKNNIEKENYQNRTIKESINRIQNIVDIVNLYSSNISGYLKPNTFSLIEVLDEAIKRNQPIWDFQAKLKKIDYEIIKTYTKDYLISGSRSEMLDTLIHVIRNALESMTKGGTLTLELHEFKRGFIDIVIKDTGIGLDWQSKERVFEPFFTTKKLKRKGLGLSFAYGVTRKHRGNIKFESQEHQGSKVTLSIPYKTVQENQAQKEIISTPNSKEEAPKKSKKILLVDDEKLIINTTAKIIEKLSDAEVLKANNGNTAIALFREHYKDLDLIISDLGMDELSGFDVAKFIQDFSKSHHIQPPRFVLYTGWGNHVTEEEMKHYGIEAVYNKPLAPNDFKIILNPDTDTE